MTKKHYEMIAEAIRTAKGNEGFTAEQMANEIIFQLGDAFRKDNERFNIYKFAEACNASDL